MRLLSDAFEYNGWATRQLGEVCRGVPVAQLTGKEEWQYQPISGLWRHIVQVERAYLRLMGVTELTEPGDDLESLLGASERARAAYVAFAAGLDEGGMERTFNVPWFERDFTVGDGLFQVVAHSIEHRADIAHFLSRLGYETPGIDYVMWVYLRDGGKMPGA
ncbi:MAG: DinB family protein [Tepidiformaceae bacterium]